MKDWKIAAGFGPQLEFYLPATVHLDTPELGRSTQTVRFRSRNNMEYYAAWDRPGSAFRWIDEPTNRFFAEARYKNVMAFGLDVFHPKMFSEEITGLSYLQLTRGFMQFQTYADAIFVLAQGRAGAIDLRLGAGVGTAIGYAYTERVTDTGASVANEHALSIIGANTSARTAIAYRLPGDHVTLSADADATLGVLDYAVLSGHAVQTHAAVKVGLTLSVAF